MFLPEQQDSRRQSICKLVTESISMSPSRFYGAWVLTAERKGARAPLRTPSDRRDFAVDPAAFGCRQLAGFFELANNSTPHSVRSKLPTSVTCSNASANLGPSMPKGHASQDSSTRLSLASRSMPRSGKMRSMHPGNFAAVVR